MASSLCKGHSFCCFKPFFHISHQGLKGYPFWSSRDLETSESNRNARHPTSGFCAQVPGNPVCHSLLTARRSSGRWAPSPSLQLHTGTEESRAQGGQTPAQRSHTWEVVRVGFEQDSLAWELLGTQAAASLTAASQGRRRPKGNHQLGLWTSVTPAQPLPGRAVSAHTGPDLHRKPVEAAKRKRKCPPGGTGSIVVGGTGSVELSTTGSASQEQLVPPLQGQRGRFEALLQLRVLAGRREGTEGKPGCSLKGPRSWPWTSE